MHPFYLHGDFSGDCKADTAILVKNKDSSKVGIAICHGGKDEVFFVGAGTTVGGGGDDSVGWTPGRCNGRRARRPSSSARLYSLSESGGGLIYGTEKLQVAAAQRLSSRSSASPLAATEALRSLRRTRVGVRFDYAPLLFHDSSQFALHGFERVMDDFF
jgi:hypothetical protein